LGHRRAHGVVAAPVRHPPEPLHDGEAAVIDDLEVNVGDDGRRRQGLIVLTTLAIRGLTAGAALLKLPSGLILVVALGRDGDSAGSRGDDA
jgi:hypothetical protein